MPKFRVNRKWPGYRVGNDGSVWSCKNGKHGLLPTWKKLKPGLASNGYLTVCLSRRKRSGLIERRSFCLHDLLLSAFVAPRPHGTVCRHLDGNKLNNSLDNICWGTDAENAADKLRHGTLKFGGNGGEQKLDTGKVTDIRRRYSEGEVQSKLAAEYGIHQVTVSEIVTRKIWRHV